MAEIIKISRGSVYNYLYGQPIPPHIASRIVNKTNGKIKLKELFLGKLNTIQSLMIFHAPGIKTRDFVAEVLGFGSDYVWFTVDGQGADPQPPSLIGY